LPEEYKEPDKWEREMSQVRILTKRGSAAYFLPEKPIHGKNGKRCADMVIDGVILEIDSVRAKVAGELKDRPGKGRFICYFEQTGKLHTWSYDELRSIIGR
jgi:hypothetical protein